MEKRALKPIEWVGNSYKLLKEFPTEARHQAGYELLTLQKGISPTDWRPMSTIGPGTFEIRIHVPHEYRVVSVVKFPEAIYVLHCFHKKEKKTSHRDIQLSRKAYAEMQKTRKEKKPS